MRYLLSILKMYVMECSKPPPHSLTGHLPDNFIDCRNTGGPTDKNNLSYKKEMSKTDNIGLKANN